MHCISNCTKIILCRKPDPEFLNMILAFHIMIGMVRMEAIFSFYTSVYL